MNSTWLEVVGRQCFKALNLPKTILDWDGPERLSQIAQQCEELFGPYRLQFEPYSAAMIREAIESLEAGFVICRHTTLSVAQCKQEFQANLPRTFAMPTPGIFPQFRIAQELANGSLVYFCPPQPTTSHAWRMANMLLELSVLRMTWEPHEIMMAPMPELPASNTADIVPAVRNG